MKAYALYQVREYKGFIEEYLEAVKEANATNLELLKKEADDIYSRLSSYDKKHNTVEIRLIDLDDFDDITEAVEGAENYDVVYNANDYMICKPEDLAGKSWKSLTDEQREELLACAEAVNGITGETAYDEAGEYIIDFVGTEYSVSGRLNEDGEVEIDNEAVIYCSRG